MTDEKSSNQQIWHGFIFDPEDGGSTFFQNVGKLPSA
jgi:hypothetical protein